MFARDYPLESELEKIEQWDCSDFHGLMEYIKPYWEGMGSFSKEGDIYILATGGWSGNEEVVSSIQKNDMYWMLYWHSSTRGGRHVFATMTLENIEKLDVWPVKEL